MKCSMDNTFDNEKCRTFVEWGETVWLIVNECTKLTDREYERYNDNRAYMVYWEPCENHSMERANTWSEKTRKYSTKMRIEKSCGMQ